MFFSLSRSCHFQFCNNRVFDNRIFLFHARIYRFDKRNRQVAIHKYMLILVSDTFCLHTVLFSFSLCRVMLHTRTAVKTYCGGFGALDYFTTCRPSKCISSLPDLEICINMN